RECGMASDVLEGRPPRKRRTHLRTRRPSLYLAVLSHPPLHLVFVFRRTGLNRILLFSRRRHSIRTRAAVDCGGALQNTARARARPRGIIAISSTTAPFIPEDLRATPVLRLVLACLSLTA